MMNQNQRGKSTLFAFCKAVSIRYKATKPAFRVMKITFVLITAFCLQASAKLNSQTITISLKNAPLDKVFNEIQKQTNYTFVYKWEVLQKTKPVDVQVKQASLKEVLDICFRDQPVTYDFVDNIVIVKKKDNVVVVPDLSSPGDIKGRIVNEKGEPLEGVTVTVKGTKNATAADANGQFFLKGVDHNAILVFSGINVQTLELSLDGRTDISTVTLSTKTVVEKAVLVTTGMQTFDIRKVPPASIVQVDNELVNRAVSPDILSRLTSVVRGLLVDKTAGNSLGISIDGRSTINASTQPLIYVDNFPYSGDINLINPNDVETVAVLKDAAAASVVGGPQSGNGVIVITTKKGKYNQPITLQFNSNITIGEKPDLYYDPAFLNSSDFIDVETFLFGKGFYTSDLNNNATYPALSPVVEILAQRKSGLITAEDSASRIDGLRHLDIRDDYAKYFYRSSLKQQYAINLSGGSAKNNYYFSAGYDKILYENIGDESDRLSLNSSTAFKPVKNLEIKADLVFTQTTARNNDMSEILASGRYTNIYPYAQLADAAGNPLSVIKDFRSSFAVSSPATGLLDWQYFPLKELELSDNKAKGFDIRAAAVVRYAFPTGALKGLSAEIKYQYQRNIGEISRFYSQETYYTRNYINRYSTVVNGAVTKRNIPLGAILSNDNSDLRANNGRAQLSYVRDWDNHSINTIAGIEVSETFANGNSITEYGYNSDNGSYVSVNYDVAYPIYPANTVSVTIPGSPTVKGYTLNRFRSFFANATYIYKERYSVYGSLRTDQSNLFGVKTNQKKIPLWSAGIKWDISREHFYRLSWLPSLKFRATYGFNGNIDKTIAAFTIASFSPQSQLNFRPYASITSPGNPDLRWERIGMVNLAIDFETKKGRISGTVEYWHKNGVDLLGDANIPASTGFQMLRGNFSSMVGHGMDIEIHTVNTTKKILWTSDLTFSHATDKITKNEGNLIKIPGKPVNWVFSFPWGGLDSSGDPVGYLDGHPSKSYNQIITAANANLSLMVYNGPQNPQYFGALRNSVAWKQFSMSAIISFKAGYYFKRGSIAYDNLYSSSAGHKDFEKRWRKPGDEAFTNVPAMIYPGNSSRDLFYLGSSALIEKGDHLRFKDIRLSYDITKKKNAGFPFQRMQLYIYVNNIGILWRANDEGIDPDAVSGYPQPRTYSFGIAASL